MAVTRYLREDRDNGHWETIAPGDRRTITLGRSKRDAIQAARNLVRREGGGEIRTVNQTGKITDIETVPR